MQEKRMKIDWKFLIQFSIDDFRSRHAGSVGGASWEFIRPTMTIVIYWFIFQVGFRSQPVSGYPFILWLVSGIIPWFFISEASVDATPSLAEYSYLVKKVLFNVDILPLSRIMSSFLVQIFLLLIAVVFFMFFGYLPDVYYLQIPYYMLYMVLLLTGIGYCTAALYPFFKDLLQMINIITQVAFWLTPIVWNVNIMPPVIQKILMLNPFYYIVQGYREALIYKQLFWENWQMGIYYWAIALFFLWAGRRVFKKMKAHFADVL